MMRMYMRRDIYFGDGNVDKIECEKKKTKEPETYWLLSNKTPLSMVMIKTLKRIVWDQIGAKTWG